MKPTTVQRNGETESVDSIIIPTQFDGLPVTEIGENALSVISAEITEIMSI